MGNLSIFAVILATYLVGVFSFCVVQDTQCYLDEPSHAFSFASVRESERNTNEWCAQKCQNEGKSVAGTKDGSLCYCGEISGDAKLAEHPSACNTPCSGSEKQICGSSRYISVSKVDCTEEKANTNPCRNSPFKELPFCNPALPIDDRVKDAISRLTLAEKINCTSTTTSALKSLGLDAYNWWSEATHGVSHISYPEATNFALPITTAMSFNRSLWWYTASHIAHEGRAMFNVGKAYSTFWAPVINLAREPRWGRNIECPGEDPYLTGQYAVYFVKGFQEAPEDPYHVLGSACCKHYVANEMEHTTEGGITHTRHEFDASVTIQDLVDSYMAPFQACVEVGRVTGLMCSYNAVNGVPSCANTWLLKEVARGDWNFDGYITSDCDADSDVFHAHKYTATPEETVKVVFEAGTDIDCIDFVKQNAQSALNKGVIKEADIDNRLAYLFKVRMRLGHFDPVNPLDSISTDVICSDYGLALARDGTTQSCALIKNDGNTLPLNPAAKLKIAIIGPNYNLSKSIAGYYGPTNTCGAKFWTLVDAISPFAQVTVAPGLPSVLSNNLSLIPEAVAAAKVADLVVLAVGTDLTWAHEEMDATSIVFNEGQNQLIRQVSAAAKKPAVIVLFTATPIDLTEVLGNSKIGAILHVGQPSVQTLGIGDLLFGIRVPAGRIVQTILPASYANQVSIFDFNMRPGASSWPRPDCTQTPPSRCPNGTNPGRTYRFYTGSAVVPFGFGLSYTTFSYAIVEFPARISLNFVEEVIHDSESKGLYFPPLEFLNVPLVKYVVNVTNSGEFDADDVVLGFIVPPNAGKDGIPLQYLFGFERVHVPKGKTVSVFLYPSIKDFTFVDTAGKRVAQPGEYIVQFGIPETRDKGQGFAVHKVIASVM